MIRGIGKKIRKLVNKNWLWIVVGMALTRKAVEFSYAERGYITIGGEWFILPVMLMATQLIPEVVKTVLSLFREGDLNDAGSNKKVHR